jgi:hypothetical protein
MNEWKTLLQTELNERQSRQQHRGRECAQVTIGIFDVQYSVILDNYGVLTALLTELGPPLLCLQFAKTASSRQGPTTLLLLSAVYIERDLHNTHPNYYPFTVRHATYQPRANPGLDL